MQRNELLGEKKTEYTTMYNNTCIYLIQKSYNNWGKDT